MSEESEFTIHLEHLRDYEFKVRFDWERAADVLMDEPPPLGTQAGPNAARMLAAATGNCLGASLLYCLSRREVPTRGLRAEVTCRMVRNRNGRLRVGGMAVRLVLAGELSQSRRRDRCLELFEDFCVVSGSIRQGIPIQVDVVDPAGQVLKHSE